MSNTHNFLPLFWNYGKSDSSVLCDVGYDKIPDLISIRSGYNCIDLIDMDGSDIDQIWIRLYPDLIDVGYDTIPDLISIRSGYDYLLRPYRAL